MGGIIGRLFREFAVTVSVAVVASAFVSLTLTPVMCSLFLKQSTRHAGGRLNRMAEGFFNWHAARLRSRPAWVFRHQFTMLLRTLGLIVLTGYLYIVIPKGFFPEQDTGFIFGEVDTRQECFVRGDHCVARGDHRYRPQGSGGDQRVSRWAAPTPITRPRTPRACSSS